MTERLPKNKSSTQNLESSKNQIAATSYSIEGLIIAKVDLQRALNELKFIDQIVLFYRYLEGEQLDQIANHLNKNQSAMRYTMKTVSQIEQRALRKLRGLLGKEIKN